MTAITFSPWLKEMACHASYPLNSENASPPGTFTVYLSWAALTRHTRTERNTKPVNIFFFISILLSENYEPRRVAFYRWKRVESFETKGRAGAGGPPAA